MTRFAWIAAFLLLASNAAWIALWLGREEAASDPFFEREHLEEQVADLQVEVERLRAEAQPVLPGLRGSGEERAPEAEAARESTSPSGPEVDGPQGRDGEAAAAAEAELRAKREQYAAAREQIKGILARVMQVKDPALRSEGMAELTAALKSTDETLVEYALGALHALRETEIDRSALRSTVVDLLKSDHGGIRRSAMYALHATGMQAADSAHALAGVDDDDPIVRMHVARVLRLYNGGSFEGPAAAALARLLRDDTSHVRRGTLRALHGVQLTDDVERALIEVAARPAERHEAVQHGLSVAKNKSRVVIDALFTHLADENGKIRQRAHWGLQRSIPESQRPYVARGYADRLETFVNPKTHTEALKLIARFGDASLVPQLERFADNDLVEARVREMATKAAEYLRSK